MPGLSDLLERQKNLLQLLRRNAKAGILDLEAQAGGAGRRLVGSDPEGYAALLGKLDGIAQQIEKDLAQPPFIAEHDLG